MEPIRWTFLNRIKKILKRTAPKEHFQKEERPKYFKATSAKKAFS